MIIRYLTFSFAMLCTFILGAEPVAAHFDVFVGRPTSGTQTVFGGIDVDDSDVALSHRVFEAEMGEDPFDGTFVSDEPGFNHPADDAALPAGVASLMPGDEVFVAALPLTVDGITDSLFYWNGMGGVTFAPAVGVGFAIDTGNMTGSIGTAGAGGGFDDHPFFVLDDGDGMAATFPTPGIYLASFQAEVADLDPSGPLYLVMGTEGLITAEFLGIGDMEFEMLSDDELDEALEEVIEMAVVYVERNVAIPEPGSLTLLGVAVGGIGLERFRRRSVR